MKKITIVLAALLLIVTMFFVGCKPEDSDVRVTTYTPQDITTTTAKCGGDVIVAQGLTLSGLGVCWSSERNPTVADSKLSTSDWNVPYVCTITNLEPGTNYHIRAFAIRGLEYYYGEDVSFTTQGGELPTVTTLEVTNIMKNTATGGGNITSNGGVPIIECGICWSVNSNPTIEDAHSCCSNNTYNGGNISLGSYNVEMAGLEQNTQYYVRAYAKNYYGISYGSQVNFTTLNPPPIGTYNGHDYVDLGLPSGTLWATCNVGAATPEGYGDYFAWGETEPKSRFDYVWDTYKYCILADQRYFLTKYCCEHGYNGFTDNLFVLLPIDDAATANWGEGWSTPSPIQWTELWQNTTNTEVTQNGVKGRLLTSHNGNSLFLPASGGLSGNQQNNHDFCRYWSNKCLGSYEAVEYRGDVYARSIGYPVRPVHSVD